MILPLNVCNWINKNLLNQHAAQELKKWRARNFQTSKCKRRNQILFTRTDAFLSLP